MYREHIRSQVEPDDWWLILSQHPDDVSVPPHEVGLAEPKGFYTWPHSLLPNPHETNKTTRASRLFPNRKGTGLA